MSTSDSEREKKLTSSFLTPKKIQIGEFTLWPFSLGTVDVAKELDLTFLFDSTIELSEEEMSKQVVTLLWMQTRDPDEVLAALEKGDVKTKVRRFSFDVSIEMMAEFKNSLAKTKVATDAAAYEVIEKDGTKTEAADPNA